MSLQFSKISYMNKENRRVLYSTKDICLWLFFCNEIHSWLPTTIKVEGIIVDFFPYGIRCDEPYVGGVTQNDIKIYSLFTRVKKNILTKLIKYFIET